jgi:hypothetical protein
MAQIHLGDPMLEVYFGRSDGSDLLRLIERLRLTSDFWLFGLQKSQFSNLGEFSLLSVRSAKARAPCFDQMVVDLLHCDPMTTVAPPPELLISSNLEYFLSLQRPLPLNLLRVCLSDLDYTSEK